MTPKSLFNIVLKIFGLFFLREIIFIIPQLISSIPFFTPQDNFGSQPFRSVDILPFILTIFAFLFYVFIIYQLLFNTNKIIDKLKLDKGFNQQEFSINISVSLTLTISLIVIGGVIQINEIPNFFRYIFSYFQEKNLTRGMTKPNISYLITSGVKIILGLLILGERKRIVEFVVKRQDEGEEGKEIRTRLKK